MLSKRNGEPLASETSKKATQLSKEDDDVEIVVANVFDNDEKYSEADEDDYDQDDSNDDDNDDDDDEDDNDDDDDDRGDKPDFESEFHLAMYLRGLFAKNIKHCGAVTYYK